LAKDALCSRSAHDKYVLAWVGARPGRSSVKHSEGGRVKKSRSGLAGEIGRAQLSAFSPTLVMGATEGKTVSDSERLMEK
jgi:hypothetical protein